MAVKKYYTRKEVDKIMYSYIRETAEELKNVEYSQSIINWANECLSMKEEDFVNI